MGHFPLIAINPGKGSPIGNGGQLIPETHSRESSGRRNDMAALDTGNMPLSLRVLREVTNNFSDDHIVGRGGFGVVYRGRLQDGTDIAVKRMKSFNFGDEGMGEFKAEIAMLTKVRHRHLVALLGYCSEANERLLVYEYMPGGTLGQHVFEYKKHNWPPLTWKQRLIIALDVARGVEYLHSLALKCFIHRDLKPSNILLGDDMRAKVSDFGLIRPLSDGKDSVFTRVAGTFGYLAPEYVVTGRVTTKADVYSVGVILMELIAGKSAVDDSDAEKKGHLTTWFRRAIIDKDAMTNLVDPVIELDDDTLSHIHTVAELAGYCTSRDPMHRPDMGHVVNVLSPLVENWKPTEEDDGFNMIFSIGLPQAVQRWQAGSSMTGDFGLFGRAGDTMTSTDPPSSTFPDSVTSNDAR